MRRRDLLAFVATATTCHPLAARAQQKAMPVIGVLGLNTPTTGVMAANLSALREGLREAGYTEGQNFRIEYRWAEGHADQLPALAADLVARKVDVIVTEGGDASSLAAKSATSTIPIVFHSSSNPVAIGLVASFARPGGNLTGVSLMSAELIPKLLEQLLELVPRARVIALWVDPDEPWTEGVIGQMQEAARAKRVDLRVLKAHTENETDAAFATLVQAPPDGLVLGPVGAIRRQIAALALRHAVPAIDWQRAFADAGGLVSYGPSLTAVYHLKGIYAGKILKGAKPAELPVQQPTTFNLFINIRTAKALGLDLPQSLLARADEIIE
jgi:ABC-type uncharacterized transport system substrate-binding protein